MRRSGAWRRCGRCALACTCCAPLLVVLAAMLMLGETAPVWGISIDWVVWQALPGARMLVGSGVVVAAGLYLLHREQRAGKT